MTFNEFWKTYHREDPNEALANPHRLRIYLTSGKHHDVQFPGSLSASSTTIHIGTGPGAKRGNSKSIIFCNWDQVKKIEVLKDRAPARSRRS